MNFEGILQSLPPCDFAFAYGSGVFEQKGYENAKQAPMVDLVIATGDSAQWHSENLKMNSSHYSMLGRLGGPALAHVQDDFGAGLYYNTLVPLPESAGGAPGQQMKYGVLSTHTLVDDLLHWRTMYISGRMHKPVRIIKCTHDWVKQAARENLRHALRAALLMLPSTFTSEQLFLALAGLSYIGDFRMVFGENPNKVANIVTKSMEHFHKLYDPVIEASFPTVVRTNPSHTSGIIKYEQDLSAESTLALGMALPFHLQKRLAAAYFASQQGGIYQSLLHRIRRTGDSRGDGTSGVHTLRDFMRIGRTLKAQQNDNFSESLSTPLMDAARSLGAAPAPAPDTPISTAERKRFFWLQALRQRPGARAIAFAEAGRETMQRMRAQRWQYYVARQDKRAQKRKAADDTDNALSDEITRETLKHFSETESPDGMKSYTMAAQTPQIVAFWDEILKADPRASQKVAPTIRSAVGLQRNEPRILQTGVSKIARLHLQPAISHIVGSHARTQSIKGLITAGPVKSTVYLWQKVQKYLKAVMTKVK